MTITLPGVNRITLVVLVVALGLGMVSLANPAFAYVAGKPGRVGLSPASATFQTGNPTPIDIFFNTGNNAISGVAIRLTFPIANPADLQALSIDQASLTGWTFNVKDIYSSGGKTTVDIMALNSSTTGFTNNADIKLATITFKATAAFSGKAFTFDLTQTKMLKKSDASDILGTIVNGSYSAVGQTIQTGITPTATATPFPTATATPTPTPTSGGGVTQPTSTPTPTPVPKKSFVDIVTRQTRATPTPTIEQVILPTVAPVPTEILISINTFTDQNGQVVAPFTVSGTTVPYATVNIQIPADSFFAATTADASGRWQYEIPKLSPGTKELAVSVSDPVTGGVASKKEPFLVAGATGVNTLPLIVGVGLLVAAFVFYLLFRRRSRIVPPAPPASPPVAPPQTPPSTGASTPPV